jgi:hypothetical protein
MRKQFKELPMHVSTIMRIAEIAEREKQGDGIIFTDRHGNEILYPDEEEDDDIATAGVDIDMTRNVTEGDGSQK